LIIQNFITKENLQNALHIFSKIIKQINYQIISFTAW